MRPPFRSLWLALRRRDDGVGPGDEAFGCADGVGLTMGALTVVAAGEVALVHLVVPWPTVRAVLLVGGLWSVLAVVETWAGLRRHPHVVSERGLLLRAGPGVVAEVPWSAPAAVRRTSSHAPRRSRWSDAGCTCRCTAAPPCSSSCVRPSSSGCGSGAGWRSTASPSAPMTLGRCSPLSRRACRVHCTRGGSTARPASGRTSVAPGPDLRPTDVATSVPPALRPAL